MIGNAAELARLEAKQACAICLAEPYLVSLFPENVEFQGVKCDYCGRRSLTLGLKWIGNQCQLVFDDFYEGTAEDDKVVIFERRPDGDEIHECIGGLFPGAAVDLLADLSELLLLRLDEEDGSDPDPYYIRRNRLGEFFSVDWRNMSDSLRNEARLCNPLAFRTLERFFGPIANDATLDGKDLILSVGPTSTITTLYRARVFQSLDVLESALEHPEAQLGPLPKGLGKAGRMNASGVSVFYGATSAEVARAEVRPPVGSTVLLGQFSLVRPMRLLDLDALAQLEADPSLSLFDPEARFAHGRCDFLGRLVDRLTMPVMPQDEENSYLITQAIADYLATHAELNLDGIIFRSAQVSRTEVGQVGRNVVLFHKSSRVDKAELRYKKNRTAQVMEEDEDGTRWEPYIWWGDPPAQEAGAGPFEPDQRPVSLAIVHDSLELHRIQAVKFSAEIYPVKSAAYSLVDAAGHHST